MRAIPYLAIACAVLAGVLLNASRWLYASGTVEPGDDTPFDLMVSAPLSLIIGLVLALLSLSRGWGSRRAANAGLILNGSVLALLVGIAIFGIATFTGR